MCFQFQALCGLLDTEEVWEREAEEPVVVASVAQAAEGLLSLLFEMFSVGAMAISPVGHIF